MTTVISRAYSTAKAAEATVKSLHDEGFPADTVDMVAGDDANAMAALVAARIDNDVASEYARMLTSTAKDDKAAAVVVVRAPFTPFGAAKRAMQIVDAHPSLARQDKYIEEVANPDLFVEGSVMRSHPLFMTSVAEIRRSTEGRISHGFGWRLLSRPRVRNSVTSGGRIMGFGSLLKSKSSANSAISGGKRMFYNPAHLR